MRRAMTWVACAMTMVMAGGQVRAEDAAADSYKADTSHASVGFSIAHLVISKVKGSFNDFSATLKLSDGNLASADAVIQVASIDTGAEGRDDHLRKPDFFDAATYPEITFTSTRVDKSVLIGDLTIRGVTKEVELAYTIKGPITDPWGKSRLGFEASGSIDRTEFGLTWSKALETGGLVVGNEVELNIDVEFIKE